MLVISYVLFSTVIQNTFLLIIDGKLKLIDYFVLILELEKSS